MDAGSYDKCTSVSLSVYPSSVDCSNITNPVLGLLIVTNQNAVSSYTHFQLNVEDNINHPITCNANSTIHIGNTPKQLNATDFVPYYDGCYEVLNLEITDENNNMVLNNTIDNSHIGTQLTAMVYSSFNTCWGTFTVKGPSANKFYICDTQPRKMPIGDCESGHTLDDCIEWPSDIYLKVPGLDPYSLEPENLEFVHGINPLDVNPILYNFDVSLEIIQKYSDAFYTLDRNLEDRFRIERKWTIFNLKSKESWNYTQYIFNNLNEVKRNIYSEIRIETSNSLGGHGNGLISGNIQITRTNIERSKSLIQVGNSSDVHPSKQEGIKVFPNPATDFMNVEMDNQDPAILTLYDLFGKEIMRSNRLINIPISDLDGLFIYKIQQKDRKTASGRVLIKK